MSQTTGTGAKKILDTDDWRDILDLHNDTVDAYDGKIGTTTLPTTAQTLTGAISEHNAAIQTVNGKIQTSTLPNNANANDYKTPGNYYVSGSNTYTNLPITAGTLSVIRPSNDGTAVTQIAVSDAKAYTRFGISNTWNSWQELAKANVTNTVTFTGNSSFNEYFTLGTNKSVVGNGLYCLTLTVTTKKAVPVGEMNIGTVSVVPYWQIPCTMVMTSNSSLVGGGLISSSGGSVYISPSESIATSRTIIINYVGTYY